MGINPNELPEFYKKQVQAQDRTAPALTHLESHTGNEPLGQEEASRFTSPVHINFHSLRKRLADPDGISGKAVLDGLVKAGLFKADTTQFIQSVTFSQEKSKVEETVIEIWSVE